MTTLHRTTRMKLLSIASAILVACATGTSYARSDDAPAAQTATQIGAMNSALNAESDKKDKGPKTHVTPPARPPYLTSIEPGVPEEQKRKMEHGHKHGGLNQGKFNTTSGGFSRD